MKCTRFAIVVAILMMFGTACAPSQTAIPNLPPSAGGTSASSAASQSSQANPRPAGATQAPANPGQGSNGGPVSIRIDAPQDNSTVNTSQIEVTGFASPGAVVTVNDIILIAGADGKFSTTISLDQGPNLIEVVASNDSGSETSVELTVTYEP